jgi:hypothetical protein
MEDDDLKKSILLKLKSLNSFIRDMENFSNQYGVEIKTEPLYVAACAQRKLLRELLDLKQ